MHSSTLTGLEVTVSVTQVTGVRCKPPALAALQSGDQICCSGGPFVLRVVLHLGLRQKVG
jgi:hypothetical protein